jgi:hypothetical protein
MTLSRGHETDVGFGLGRVFVVTEQEVRIFALKAGTKALARHLLINLYRAVRRDQVREECRWLASCDVAGGSFAALRIVGHETCFVS